MKHGLLAAGITELDNAAGYRSLLRDLRRETNPVGVVEEFLVTLIALNIVRRKRVARLEAEYITGVLNPPIWTDQPTFDLGDIQNGVIADPGLPALITEEEVQILFTLFQRYATAIDQEIYRGMHELERVQRMRRGEQLAAPTAVDVTVHTEPPGENSFVEAEDKETIEGAASMPADKPEAQTTLAPAQEGENGGDERN